MTAPSTRLLSWLMAVCWRGMTPDETLAFTGQLLGNFGLAVLLPVVAVIVDIPEVRYVVLLQVTVSAL